jgi:hypothetical protein
MTNLFGTFHNVETDEVEYRELTDAEQAHIDTINANIAEAEAEAQAKAEAKATLLAKLGITEEEAQTLLS